MIREDHPNQGRLDFFKTEFSEKLSPNNRWVKLSDIVPWASLSKSYYKNLCTGQGRPAKNARLVIGAIIIKHLKSLSDANVILEVQESPYLQFFLGLEEFSYKPIFASSLFVEIRRRMGADLFEEFNKEVVASLTKGSLGIKDEIDNKPDDDSSSRKDNETSEAEDVKKNFGELFLDASVADQEIRYPTDVNLLNDARLVTEECIDELHQVFDSKTKPRTYRVNAEKEFKTFIKKRRPSKKYIKQTIKSQLQYLKRNLGYIAEYEKKNNFLFSKISSNLQALLNTAMLIYSQQFEMYIKNTKSCKDRIVNIAQPFVRPIVRGKAGSNVEFGSKICVSQLSNNIAFIDDISWDNKNEAMLLKEHVDQYKKRFGHYPEKVYGDQVYGNRENRKYLKSLNIEYVGKALGRPKLSDTAVAKKERKKAYSRRNRIEGLFGLAKRTYDLNCIKAKTKETSEAWVRSIIMVMNLKALLKVFLFQILRFNNSRIYLISKVHNLKIWSGVNTF